ncbi:MAG: glycosyltransferase [Acidimicrobiales bacterium]|nr:glycosyltransferase [Acidimicrobiales bacterium]
MSVAVVHDHLVQRGGAERLLPAILRAFPGAPLHTSLYDPAATHDAFRAIDVTTRPIDRVAFLRRHHRAIAPLLAPTFSTLHLDADLIFCSSAGWSHGTVATAGRKLVYFHAPARWLYARTGFLSSAGPVVRLAAAATRAPLLRWDRRAAATIDGFIANSSETARRLGDAYGVHAPVVPPPLVIDPGGVQRPVDGIAPGFALVVARLIGYKHVDAVVAAFAGRRDDSLVVVGDGPDAERIRADLPANVTLVGLVDDPELRWLYAHARLLVSASHEDFGMTPPEAGVFGLPVAVLRAGGHLDTVVEGATGAFFDRPDPAAISEAIDLVDGQSWDAARIRAHARSFDEDGFARRLRSIAAELVGVDALGPAPPTGDPVAAPP